MKETDISLFINCATKKLQFALLKGDKIYKEEISNPKRALEESHLAIKRLLDKCSIRLKDVRSFYCLLGPGSNTGIRLGLTIPKTIFALDNSINLYGINTLKLLSLNGHNSVLSDRNGNLFYYKKDEVIRVDKEDIGKIDDDIITVESSDQVAIEELFDHELDKVDVVDMMIKYKDKFTSYSSRDEEYLPEYMMKI